MIKDSGNRREFESGAVRDIQVGKGRMDLLPLEVISKMADLSNDEIEIVHDIHSFIEYICPSHLFDAISHFINYIGCSPISAVFEVSIHYEEGALKYGEHNWEKGIPLHCFIDSGLRHLFKYFASYDDERHDRAFIWNMIGAIWTIENRPECIDMNPMKVI